MGYINVGAWVNGERPRTKAALKRAMKDRPSSVWFDVTSMFHNGPNMYKGSELPQGDKLSVCGPDPYSDRAWFATVTDQGRVS
jgi:hypothetical protein